MKHASLSSLLAAAECPHCKGAFTEEGDTVRCSCRAYAIREGKIFFIEPPQDYEDDGEGPNVIESGWSPWRKRNYTYFERQLASAPDDAVLVDLGIGPGQFSRLEERFRTVIGIDFRPFKPVQFVADITQRLPLKDASADIVVLSNVFEHISDTAKLLAELRRVLTPGGRVVATIPFLMRIHQKPHDYNRYTHYQLRELVTKAGFTDVTIESLSTPSEVYASMQEHFFLYLIGATSGLVRFVARFVRRCTHLLTRLCMPLYRRAGPSLDYTQGYGFTATRP